MTGLCGKYRKYVGFFWLLMLRGHLYILGLFNEFVIFQKVRFSKRYSIHNCDCVSTALFFLELAHPSVSCSNHIYIKKILDLKLCPLGKCFLIHLFWNCMDHGCIPTHKFVGMNAAVGPYKNKSLNLCDKPQVGSAFGTNVLTIILIWL